MKKTIKLTESDLENLVKKIIKEGSIKEQGFKGGMTFGPFRDIVDAVTDRYRLYREDYKEALDIFNENWPLDERRIRTIPPGGGR
jgi:hypothetical protein